MLRFFIIIFVFFVSFLHADIEPNNDCYSAEKITQLDNISVDSKQVTTTGSIKRGTDVGDLYVFKPNTDGYINITPQAVSSVSYFYLVTNSTCTYNNQNQIEGGMTRFTSSTGSIKINANQMIYVYVSTTTTATRTYKFDVEYLKNFIQVDTVEREFRIRNPESTQNIKGSMVVIGNTVLCVKNTRGVCVEGTSSWSNSQENLRYVNIDSATGEFPTSSSANLLIPPNAKIVWAGVYAQGYLQRRTLADSQRIVRSKIKIKTESGFYELFPEIVNLFANGANGYSYGSYIPFPNIVGLKGSELNGRVTAHNIQAYEGTDNSGLGNSGAWSLVVIYEEDTETLKNISVFDGFKQVSAQRPAVNINISGFLTPSSGTVNSMLSMFVGEGDRYIEGDNFFVNDVRIASSTFNNAMDSSITGVPVREPFLINNQGIDIQNHNISNYIPNSATSASIRLTSSQDTYFPLMIGFSTQLYEPRVCYFQELLNEHGNETLTNIKNGDVITVRTWFSNLPNTSGGSVENAKKVKITSIHDPANLEYIADSTKVKNIQETVYTSRTDKAGDDIITFNATSNTSSWHLGRGADVDDGGLFEVNDPEKDVLKAFVDYKAKISTPTTTNSTSITIRNQYKISYEDSTSGQRFGDGNPLSMGSCKALNESINFVNSVGSIIAVNENFSGNIGDEIDLNKHSQVALYTQVAGAPFKVKLLHISNDGEKRKIVSVDKPLKIKIDFVSLDQNSTDKDSCKNAKIIKSNVINENNFTKSIYDLNITLNDVVKSGTFRINIGNGNETEYSCSRDNFALRPATYKVDSISNIKGGAKFNYKIEAVDIENKKTKEYNANLQKPFDPAENVVLDKPNSCDVTYNPTELNGTIGNFTQGEATSSIKYDNVGVLNITLIDSSWASIDATDDCNNNTKEDNSHTNGKVGCNIIKTMQFVFVPKGFNSKIVIRDFNNGDFTYLSENDDMYASIVNSISAVLNDDTTVATNYHQNCWAYNTDVSMDMNNTSPTGWNNSPNRVNDDAKTKVKYFSKDARVDNVTSGSDGNVKFKVKNNHFINGMAEDIDIGFNFERVKNKEQNPFTIKNSDFSVKEIKDTNGTEFNQLVDENIESSAKFLYGRVWSDSYSGPSPLSATMNYEAYCGVGCNSVDYNLGTKNTYGSWYLNEEHLGEAAGNVVNFNQVSGGQIINFNPPNSINILDGQEDNIRMTLGGAAPYADDIRIFTQSWLIYNTINKDVNYNQFKVEFTSDGGGWAGVGRVSDDNSTGRVVEQDASKRTKQKIDW